MRTDRANRPRRTTGFTLLEILIVIALIALTTTLAALSWTALADAFEDKPTFQVFREMVQEARHQAYQTREPVHLAWDDNAKLFRIYSPFAELEDLVLSEEAFISRGDTEVRFYPLASPEKGASLNVRGVTPEYQSEPVSEIIFHPSGVSTGARIEIDEGPSRSVITLEPFSAGPIDYEPER
ncbi:MAG: Tfp pilus assembly protein FimT/FimU [Opitutales bacterium]